jgi:hypothetical protein
MAKRMKLDDALEVLVKTAKVQDMMNIPEAKKLYDLDVEMKSILEDDKVEVDEKVRKYERALADYRNVQSRIISNGGLSMMNVTRDATEEEFSATAAADKIEDSKKILKELILEVMKQEKDGSPDSTREETAGSALDKAEVHGPDTPIQIVSNKSLDSESFATPPEGAEVTTPRAKVLQTLQERGIVTINGDSVRVKVHDPNTPYKRGAAKMQELTYKTKTYSKALDYLLSASPGKTPQHVKRMVGIIYQGMKDNMPNFEEFARQFPNLYNRLSEEIIHSIRQEPWETLK